MTRQLTIARTTITYTTVLLLLASVISLWLDEILTLIGSTQPTFTALLDYIRTVPGGTPLAFLPSRLTIATLGDSLIGARLPSILASAATLPGIFLLSQRLGLRAPLAAVAVFALWPLQLRYALEARPYALALCFTVWLTVLILNESRARLYAVFYVALTILAALTQPYALFIPIAHLTRRRKLPLIALTLATLALIPWYAYFRADWSRVTQDQNLAAFDMHAPLVLLHEISGSGYIGLAILAIGAFFARQRDLWLWIVIPIALALAANTAFHYFFATRQVIYILPALAILFVAGTERLGHRGYILLAAFLAASLYEDVNWFRKPHENWQAAADHVASHIEPGSCIYFTGDSVPLFYYFHPEFAEHRCTPELADRLLLAITPYREDRDYPSATGILAAGGLHKQSEQSFNGPRVEVWSK